MIHVGIAIAILMGSLLLGVSIPFAFGAGTIYMYTMLGGTFATTLPVGFNGINTVALLMTCAQARMATGVPENI